MVKLCCLFLPFHLITLTEASEILTTVKSLHFPTDICIIYARNDQKKDPWGVPHIASAD
jgi:hypothetical protein